MAARSATRVSFHVLLAFTRRALDTPGPAIIFDIPSSL